MHMVTGSTHGFKANRSLSRRQEINTHEFVVGDSPPAAPALFAALQTLDQLCGTANAAIAAGSFGRFSNDGDCSYDCGFKEQDWNWWFDVSDWMRNGYFYPWVTGNDLLGPFTNAFSATRQWVLQSLPGTDQRVTAAIAGINSIDAAIAQSGSETPQQAGQLAVFFADAQNNVGGNLTWANQALQTLAAYISWISQPSPSVTTLLANTTTTVDTWIQNQAMDLMGQLSCGSGTVQDQYNGARDVVNQSIALLANPFTAVANQAAVAIDAGSAVAGAFLPIQSMSDLVTQNLTQAQTYPAGSALRLMHMTEAAQNWQDLVSYAQAQLTPSLH
ncbi:MAG: hypothetical protein H0W24_05910 [Lysobacter sp.]|nr:hypothetical protein [Lysobacter sp.]